MSQLILVVDDEPDVEVLFRQHFRRDLRAGDDTAEGAKPMGKLGQANDGGAEHRQCERHRINIENDKLAAINPRPGKEAGRGDMDNLSIYREARNRFATVTPPSAPAVTLVEVSRLYGSDFLIEIEAIAPA